MDHAFSVDVFEALHEARNKKLGHVFLDARLLAEVVPQVAP